MRTSHARALAAATAVGVLGATSACMAEGRPDRGDMRVDAGLIRLCPADPSADLSVAFGVGNPTLQPMVIDVSLINPDVVLDSASFVIDVPSSALAGATAAWPPAQPEVARAWQSRRPARGATLMPHHEGTVVVRLSRMPEVPLRFESVAVTYQHAGTTHVLVTTDGSADLAPCPSPSATTGVSKPG